MNFLDAPQLAVIGSFTELMNEGTIERGELLYREGIEVRESSNPDAEAVYIDSEPFLLKRRDAQEIASTENLKKFL